jgi:hypothetical protein
MSKTWKWILGIVLVLVLIGAMFVVGYAWRAHTLGGWMTPYGYTQDRPFERNWNGPMMGRGDDGWRRPMMVDRGLMPFGGFFLFGGLLKWILFFGLLYGAYWLGRRNARISLDPRPASPVDASAPPKTPEQDS